MEPRLIKFHDKGRAGVITAGKFVEVSGKRIYCYNIQDELRILDGFGIAPCVLQACRQYGIQEIHYIDKANCVTYITTPNEARAKGVLFQGRKSHAHPRGTYYHVPRQFWRTDKRQRRYPYATGTIWLEWVEPEPQWVRPVRAQMVLGL